MTGIDWQDAFIPISIDIAFIVGIVLLGIGVIKKRRIYLICTGFLILPFIYYLSGGPNWRWVLLLPFAIWGLAYYAPKW